MVEPPFVVVKSPDDGIRLTSLTTELALYVEDRHQPIRSVKVMVNGRTIATAGEQRNLRLETTGPDIPAGQKKLSLRFPIKLDPGENLIEVAAFNGVSEGRTSLHITAVETASTPSTQLLPNLWILGIAVNRYDSPGVPSLQYAVADVRGITAAFAAQKGRLFGDVHTLILADDAPLKPTRENIVDSLGFLRKAGQNDMALLFVSGYGANDATGNYFFIPADFAFQGDGCFDPLARFRGAI